MLESTPTPPPADLTELAAVAGIFRRPSATFASLIRKPTWWLPVVAGAVLAALFSIVMVDKVNYDASMRQALEKRAEKSGQAMPAAELDKAVDRAVEMQRKLEPVYPVIGAVGYAFVFFLTALVLAFGGNAFGAEAGIPSYFALYSHAQIPLLLRSVYGIARLLAAGDASLTLEGLGRVATVGPALLLPSSPPAALLALASSFDLFLLAALALVICGFRQIPGLSRSSATAVPVALWIVFVLLRVGWGALFG